MPCRITIAFIAILSVANAVSVAEQSCRFTDPFELDGAKNILAEKDFGIINGKATCGIEYRDAFSISGLWAPPYVSSDFTLGVTVMGQAVAASRYTWHPFCVERTGEVHGIAIDTCTMLLYGSRAGVIEIVMKNASPEPRTVPLSLSAAGSLDRSGSWEFNTPLSKTATTRKIVDNAMQLLQGDMAIVLRADGGVQWKDAHPCGAGSIVVPAAGSKKLCIVFAIGPADQAKAACEKIATAPETAMREAQAAYAGSVQRIYEKLPRLESNNPAFEQFYNRSLVHFIMNRWDVPEFALNPYYSTGSVKGGCVCEYLWNFAETWEIFPLYDATADRSHIKQFLALDMTTHYAFDPITGKAFGPWYMVNQEKLIGLIYYYILNTGDVGFLNDVVGGKTVLEHVLQAARYGDDPSKPIALIDYGPSNAHLELRGSIPYDHIMPDLNGRRYQNFVLAAEMAVWAGKPAPELIQRANELKVLLKKSLWNKQTRWFDFVGDKGKRDTRYTLQMFKMLGSKVLDAEEEKGLLEHLLSEKEFLAEFGLHSMAKQDPAYDPNDVDNGGPGACSSWPPQIAERLYKGGNPAAAENILKRLLWWSQRMPYWADSIVADKIDYRHDTPLQCMVDGVAVAQSIIFGVFGVSPKINGDIYIDPHPLTFASKMALKGLRLRGHVLDIDVADGKYEVREGGNRISVSLGQSVLVRGSQLSRVNVGDKLAP